MSLALILFFVWIVSANLIALLPTRDHHWRAAYFLIAIGVPLLAWVTWENGWVIGLICLIAAASILRWPVIYLARWVRRVIGPSE